MSRLGWVPSFTITDTRAGLVLRSDRAALHLAGPDARAFAGEVAPLLDGTRDRAAIEAALGAYSPQSIEALLDDLVRRGLVVDVDMPSAWEAACIRMAGSASFLDFAAEALREAGARDVARLEEAGIEGAALLVAGFGPGDREALFRMARLAHDHGVVSLWAEIGSHEVVLGPLVHPGRTACRVCAGMDWQAPGGFGSTSPPVHLPPLPEGEGGRGGEVQEDHLLKPRILGALLASAAIEALAAVAPRLGGRLLVQDLLRFTSSWRTPARAPWCPVCGEG